MLEASLHPRNSFLTLTYDEEHCPSDGGLRVKDWQKFAKRVRKQRGPFRFFHCGEYGEENGRPHYHACVFGLDFSEDRRVVEIRPGGHELFQSPELDKLWGMGSARVGRLSLTSAMYVARYVMKKRTGKQAESAYCRVDPRSGECWDVRPPYVTMSRRPGLASKWFERYASDVYPQDEVVVFGRRYRPPRYFDAKLEESSADTLSALKAKRVKAVAKRRAAGDLSPERLKVREHLALYNAKRSVRSI